MSSASRRKVLLMGKSGACTNKQRVAAEKFLFRSGKTSMRSVIFSNYSAKDTRRLGATIDVEQSAVRLLGSLVLNLWDCGGQDAFLDNYLSAQRDTVFSNVAVLIYVFDVTSHEWETDVRYFEENLEALRENSPDAGVWVLVNKMDLVDKEDPKRTKYAERKAEILALNDKISADEPNAGPCRCFPTSIWDESLYKAWSSVIHTLIPNISLITAHLSFMRDLCAAAEAVMFEGDTFLVMAKSGSPLDSESFDEFDSTEQIAGYDRLDRQRFEKISEIIKSFRKTCQRTGETFIGFESVFDGVTVVLEPLTKNTFILIVSTDPRIQPALIKYNIHMAQLHFAEIATMDKFVRKCNICCATVKTLTDVSYDPAAKDDPKVRAWDDVGIDLATQPPPVAAA